MPDRTHPTTPLDTAQPHTHGQNLPEPNSPHCDIAAVGEDGHRAHTHEVIIVLVQLTLGTRHSQFSVCSAR